MVLPGLHQVVSSPPTLPLLYVLMLLVSVSLGFKVSTESGGGIHGTVSGGGASLDKGLPSPTAATPAARFTCPRSCTTLEQAQDATEESYDEFRYLHHLVIQWKKQGNKKVVTSGLALTQQLKNANPIY